MRNFYYAVLRVACNSLYIEIFYTMKESLRLRLDQLSDRHEELTALLADVEVISDNKRFRQLSREHSDLEEITAVWSQY